MSGEEKEKGGAKSSSSGRIDESSAIEAMGLDLKGVDSNSVKGRQEEDYLVDKEIQEEIRRRHAIQNDSDQQDVFERKRYASHAYSITQAWIGFLIVVTIAQMALAPFGMSLKTAEYVAFVTTTTASVFGFWLLVGNYLFSRRGEKGQFD